MSHSLIPIRVDAWSADKSTRIVDTFLLDPTCWPLASHSADPSVLVEENTQFLADTLLLDAEVMGMGRGDKGEFTGRQQLWNFSLQQRLCDQIRGQLWRVLTMTGPRRELKQQRQARLSMDLTQSEPSQTQEPVPSSKRPVEENELDENRPSKRAKPENDVTDAEPKAESVDVAETIPAAKPDEAAASSNPATQSGVDEPASNQTVVPPPTAPPVVKPLANQVSSSERPPSAVAQTKRDPIYASKMPLGNLIPVRIRLTAFGVRVHDDFYIDPVLDTSPLLVAQSIAKDLRLSDDLIVALAIDIAEQLHGMKTVQDPILPTYDKEQGAPVPTDKKHITAAFKLEQRVHITNVAHLVHDYRA